ncbi:hypothetical protein [Nostoc sp. KVJ20]|nr:hypothetical protein [Nostoc sp. KVJ20]
MATITIERSTTYRLDCDRSQDSSALKAVMKYRRLIQWRRSPFNKY